MAADRSLSETVARLQGCLSALPERPRRALMLRTGVGTPQALSPRATAARLHLGVARFALVERQALGELRNAARTGACGQLSELVAAVVAFVGPSGGGGRSGATRGAEAISYTFRVPSRHAIGPAASTDRSLLGSISPTARDGIAVLLLALAAAAAAAIVLIRGSGYRLSSRHWPRRVGNGLRRRR